MLAWHDGDADEPVNAGIVVCVAELADMCRVVLGDRYDVVSDAAGSVDVGAAG